MSEYVTNKAVECEFRHARLLAVGKFWDRFFLTCSKAATVIVFSEASIV